MWQLNRAWLGGGWKKIHSWCLSLSYLNPFWHNLTYGKNSGRIFYALVMNGLKHCASHNVSVNVNQPVYLRNHVSFFSQLLDTEILLTLMWGYSGWSSWGKVGNDPEEEISPVSGASATTSQYYQKIYDLLPTSCFQFQGHRPDDL